MAKKDFAVIKQEIPSIEIPWVDEDNETCYDGRYVERFIKKMLKERIGYITISEKQTDGYYHIWGFHSNEAYNEYRTDPDSNSGLRLVDVAIPIQEDTGVSNIVTLDRLSSDTVATSNGKVSIRVKYLWQQYNPINQQTTDMSEDASLVVQVRMQTANGSWGAWLSDRQITSTISSGQTKDIDISSILTSDGTYQVRVIATGEMSGIQAAPVVVKVLYSNVQLSYEGLVSTVYTGTRFNLPFRISGSTERKLYLKVGNYSKPFSLGTTPYVGSTYPAEFVASEFSIKRGVTTVEAWVAFGEEYAYETDHIFFQFIYVPAGDTSTSPILATTDIVSQFDNWTRVVVFKYAVYNPAEESTQVTIKLADRDTSEVYLEEVVDCVNGEVYSYDHNFAIQPDTDNRPTTINGQIQFADSQGRSFGNNINVTINNEEDFSATRGATFILNPETKSIAAGNVSWELSELISDTVDTNSGWKTSEEEDSTGAKVQVPILSIAAGNRIVIPYQLFDSNTGHFIGGVEGSTTIEFDYRVKNIVSENDVIIDSSTGDQSSYMGLKVYPLKAACMSEDDADEDLCSVGLKEGNREHLAFNIIRNLRGEGINYVKTFINGVSNNSHIYGDETKFVPTKGGNQNITIGSDTADIEIFGIRIYKGVQLDAMQIQNDYMAGMPTIEDKKAFKLRNKIFNGTNIDYETCNNNGFNTILRRIPEGGHYPSFDNPAKQKKVDVVVKIFDEKGNPESLDRKHSGTFYNMSVKGQGTSAMGYYWWNTSDGFEEPEELTEAQYDPNNPTHYTEGSGDVIKYYQMKSYFCSEDGTSQMYVQKYEIEEGRGGITKLNGKANYASSMQSHKLGGIWMYDELWQRLVNNGAGGRQVLDGHACCYEKPFLAFYQIGSGPIQFCGFQTWGSAKGDKKTFGFDKKEYPGYMCVSGADNGAAPALYQMPIKMTQGSNGLWSGNMEYKTVTINTGAEKNGYCYKIGKSHSLAFEVEIADKYDGGEAKPDNTQRIADELKGEAEVTFMTHFAKFTQFICSASPLLEPWNGTVAELQNTTLSLKTDHQYWIAANNEDRYRVFCYNHETRKFEEYDCTALTWGEDGRAATVGKMKLTEQLAGIEIEIDTVSGPQTVTLEYALDNTSDFDEMNDYFAKARVVYFKSHADAYMDVTDVIFHQCYMKLEAGTDNRAKNTYPWILGRNKTNTKGDYLVRWKQDDVDTIMKTDNQGLQTKPYYILEHTKYEGNTNYWNGENNVCFTLVERAYPERMRTMMRDMFSAMAQISGSVFQYYEDRFFWVQRYFPESAYNETTRLLYETAKVLSMENNVLHNYSQDPITQALGNQLECELQFVSQRIPMLMSWCEYEAFEDRGTLSFRTVSSLTGNSNHPVYDVEFTAYQYIYPKMAIGGNVATLYAKKDGQWVEQYGEPYLCAPGETVRLVAGSDTNTQFTMQWMNYCTKLGNMSSLSVSQIVNIAGNRLREITIAQDSEENFNFRGNVSIVGCRNLESVNFTNAPFGGTFGGDGYNSGTLPRCKRLLLEGTQYRNVAVPETSALVELTLPSTLEKLNLLNQPNLSSLSLPKAEKLDTCRVLNSPLLDSYSNIAAPLYREQSVLPEEPDNPEEGVTYRNIQIIEFKNVNWRSVNKNVLMWYADLGADISGSVAITTNSTSDNGHLVTFADKMKLANMYGNIDNQDNPSMGKLYVDYTKINITEVSIVSDVFIYQEGEHDITISARPSTGNNFAILDNGYISQTFSWGDNDATTFAEFENVHEAKFTRKHTTSYSESRYTINYALDLLNGATKEASHTIAFYRREPQVGDFAYGNGVFDDHWHDYLGLVGMCFMKEAKKTDNIITGYCLHVISLENVALVSEDKSINMDSFRWGLYPDNNGTNGFPTTDTNNAVANALGVASFNAFDIADLKNFGSRYLYDENNADTAYLTEASYCDNSTEDGYKILNANSVFYDFDGKENTRKIMEHCRKILLNYVGGELPIEMPTNNEEYCNLLKMLRTWSGETKTIYDEFAFPAAFVCTLYQPNLENLHPAYQKGSWYLPSEGELARVYNFKRQGLTADSANESAGLEAFTPIFANAANRAGKQVISFTNSWYWSSTEDSAGYAWYVHLSDGYTNYGSKFIYGFVRAVAAFDFEL